MSITTVIYELKKALTEAELLKVELLKENTTNPTPERAEKIESLNERIETLKDNLKLFQEG